MDDHDITLALAICQLLGKPVKPKDIEKAIEDVEKRLELSRLPPREAKKTNAHHRE
jgi:hypothetical protein